MLSENKRGFHLHICVRRLSRVYIGTVGAPWPIVWAFRTIIADTAMSLNWSLRHPFDANRWLSRLWPIRQPTLRRNVVQGKMDLYIADQAPRRL